MICQLLQLHYTIMQYEVSVMKPLKKTISITLDEPILEQIRLLSEQQDRSVSSFINLVLRDYLEKRPSP